MKLTTTNVRVFRIELEFGSVGFCGEGKAGEPGENPLRVRKERTNNKLYPHRTLCKSAAEGLNLEIPGTNQMLPEKKLFFGCVTDLHQ